MQLCFDFSKKNDPLLGTYTLFPLSFMQYSPPFGPVFISRPRP